MPSRREMERELEARKIRMTAIPHGLIKARPGTSNVMALMVLDDIGEDVPVLDPHRDLAQRITARSAEEGG